MHISKYTSLGQRPREVKSYDYVMIKCIFRNVLQQLFSGRISREWKSMDVREK